MIVYLDTSSLVKLYKEESDSAEVERLVGGAAGVATSTLTYAEAHSAFSLNRGIANARQGSLEARRRPELDTEAAYSHMVQAFDQDWRGRRYFAIASSRSVIQTAADLCRVYPLRAYDAMHVSSALLLSRRVSDQIVFSSFDPRQVAAAQAERLTLAH